MKENFELTREELKNIAFDLYKKIQIGLKEKDREIKCIPTFIPHINKLKDGRACVLDLGGSNLRGSVISFKGGKAHFLKDPKNKVMPWDRDSLFPKENFLNIHAELIASLNLHEQDYIPIGYCFSYPTESLPNRDAKLLHWTKGINIPDTEGEKIGNMLIKYLKKHNNRLKFNKISVINDAIASLFAGLIEPEIDGYIGLIVGTGTNMATFMNSNNIPKINNVPNWKGLTPVNLESGNFNPPHLTIWDTKVDEDSENKGLYRFEKAVSGMYLGRIFNAVFPDSNFDSESGSKGLVDLLNNPGKTQSKHIEVTKQIYERSSKLVAASLAGLIKILADQFPLNSIRIVAEGALFWSEVYGRKYYVDLTKTTLETILCDMNLKDIKVQFSKIEEANLIGAAIAALS